MSSSESSSSTPIVKGKMTERNSLVRKEATRILLFKFTGCSGRFCEECCCQGHSVHGQDSLQSPLFGRTLKPIRRKESLLCIQFRSHFASTACNKYLKKELGKKKADKTDIASTNASAGQLQQQQPQEAQLLPEHITANFHQTS